MREGGRVGEMVGMCGNWGSERRVACGGMC